MLLWKMFIYLLLKPQGVYYSDPFKNFIASYITLEIVQYVCVKKGKKGAIGSKLIFLYSKGRYRGGFAGRWFKRIYLDLYITIMERKSKTKLILLTNFVSVLSFSQVLRSVQCFGPVYLKAKLAFNNSFLLEKVYLY